MAWLHVQRQGSTVNSAIEADRNISNKDTLYIFEVHNTGVLDLVGYSCSTIRTYSSYIPCARGIHSSEVELDIRYRFLR